MSIGKFNDVVLVELEIILIRLLSEKVMRLMKVLGVGAVDEHLQDHVRHVWQSIFIVQTQP